VNKFCLAIVGLLVSVVLNGCAVNLNANKYALNGVCIKQHCCKSGATIFVMEPTVQPGYDTDQIIYMQCPYELKAYSRNRWIAPPHEMLTSLIEQSLRNTCFFKAVVTAPFAGQSNYRLETRLIKLQQEYFCCPSRVRMVLHVVLIETCCREIIAEKVFETVVIAPKNNPYSGVIAANKATQILLEQMSNFVVCNILAHPTLPPPRKFQIEKD
jgi:cholesterol transport system auxiliary component